MKTHVRLRIDFKVITRLPRKWGIFPLKETMYAKACYVGEIDNLFIGATLKLPVFNDDWPTEFLIREISLSHNSLTGQIEARTELYERSVSAVDADRSRLHTLEESRARLETSVAQRLARCGLHLEPESLKVGPEPSYEHLPSFVGATKSQIITLTQKF